MPKRSVDLPTVARIDEAYCDLTREAFAVWVRMSVDSKKVLEHSGVATLAERYRYKRRGFFDILRQLRNKGYVRFNTPPRGEIVSVFIERRPLLVGADHFVKLS